jgi:hypothetical protein
MPQVGSESTILVCERAKIVHALRLRGHCGQQNGDTSKLKTLAMCHPYYGKHKAKL